MFINEKEKILDFIDVTVKKHGTERSVLLPILGEIQDEFNCVPEFAQQRIAKLLEIHPVEVFSVVSFYSFLNVEKKGKNIIRICKSVSCDLAGKDSIVDILERELNIKIGETTPDYEFTLEYANCMGLCDEGPSISINDRVFTKVNSTKLFEIINQIREGKS